MERSRQMTLLCYCVQIDLPVQLETETLFIILAFMLVKQAVTLSRFHVCFHMFLRSFFPFQRVARSFAPFHVFLWEYPLLLRDVTGGSRVGARGCLMLVLCYGVYKVFDSPRYFVSADIKARVQRTGFRVVLSRVGER